MLFYVALFHVTIHFGFVRSSHMLDPYLNTILCYMITYLKARYCCHEKSPK